jgi:hypothetical protein
MMFTSLDRELMLQMQGACCKEGLRDVIGYYRPVALLVALCSAV